MKIIERGQYKKREHRITCEKCDTVFTCTDDEVIFMQDHGDSIMKIECPVCHSQIYRDVK